MDNINENKLNKMEKITEEQFEAYKDVQESGVTNMFDVKTVSQLSGLEKEDIMTIMKSYGELSDKYGY
jgi:ABC-type taurine transport system substrate-binding protein